jgi:hypothetical protein
LAEPIDFASPDGDKISILIYLLFPEIPTYEHMQILSYLAQRLMDVKTREIIQSEKCPEKICQLLDLTIDFKETLKTQDSHSGFKQYITSSNQDIQDYLEEWSILAQRPKQNLH